MTEPVMEMMNNLTSLLWEQQAYLKEAVSLLLDVCPTAQQLLDQAGSDETKIRELQEQIQKWKTLCKDLSGQNEVLARQKQELQSFAWPLIPEKESEAGTNSLSRKKVSGREEPALQDMTKEDLMGALVRERRATHILSAQKISLRQLMARLNEENEMLLSLWEEAEKKYGNAKDAYDKLWHSYELLKGAYEALRRKRGKSLRRRCSFETWNTVFRECSGIFPGFAQRVYSNILQVYSNICSGKYFLIHRNKKRQEKAKSPGTRINAGKRKDTDPAAHTSAKSVPSVHPQGLEPWTP